MSHTNLSPSAASIMVVHLYIFQNSLSYFTERVAVVQRSGPYKRDGHSSTASSPLSLGPAFWSAAGVQDFLFQD